MQDFVPEEGDRVRVDIPDETDPDHDEFHGKHGRVRNVLSDDAGEVTGNQADSLIYQVEFENGMCADFRGRDLRPPIE